MTNVDESSSEHDIVDGIIDFAGSHHDINKKAYSLKLGKGAQNKYSSRIGFNMFKLLVGEYTLAIEFFPPSMTNLSVDVVSTSLNIGQQATKLFPNYSRSIVHLHKWSTTPPEIIYIDLKCQGTASSDAQGTGYLIVYGIKGLQNDVDSAVYDMVFAMENGKMVMQTDIDLNNHKINVPQFITGQGCALRKFLGSPLGSQPCQQGCPALKVSRHPTLPPQKKKKIIIIFS